MLKFIGKRKKRKNFQSLTTQTHLRNLKLSLHSNRKFINFNNIWLLNVWRTFKQIKLNLWKFFSQSISLRIYIIILLILFTRIHSYIISHFKLTFKLRHNVVFDLLLWKRSLNNFIKANIWCLLANSLINIGRACNHKRFDSKHAFKMPLKFVKCAQFLDHIL